MRTTCPWVRAYARNVEIPKAAWDLYGLPPEEFVAARDRLAGELTSSGHADEAARVKKLRRPSLVAWAVNAVSRDRPELVAALLDAGEALRGAQRKTLTGGGREELRRATDERRALIQELAGAAVEAIGSRGPAHRDAIGSTLDAASVDEALGDRLRAGTLEREARPVAGFGGLEGFEVLTGGRADEGAAPSRDRDEDARQRAREARAAEQRAAAAERAAEKAALRADQLRRKADEAVSAARDASAAAKRLTDEAKTERRRADRASKAAPPH